MTTSFAHAAVTYHALLLLHAPFPVEKEINLESGETQAAAQQRLCALYGTIASGGELAEIMFFERLVVTIDGIKFTSEPLKKTTVDFRTSTQRGPTQ